jgi:hypothetical protein
MTCNEDVKKKIDFNRYGIFYAHGSTVGWINNFEKSEYQVDWKCNNLVWSY